MQSLVLPEAGDVRCDDVEVPHEVPIRAERGAVVVPEDPFHGGGEPLHMALGEARCLLEFLRESGDGLSELAEVLHGAGLAHRPANESGPMNLLPARRFTEPNDTAAVGVRNRDRKLWSLAPDGNDVPFGPIAAENIV